MTLFSFEGRLKPLAPFDFSKSLEFLTDFAPTEKEQMVSGASFTKAVEIKAKTVAFSVSSEGSIEKPLLHFVANSEIEFDKEIEDALVDRISFFLSLQDDLVEFYHLAKGDKALKPVIERFYGHKQVKFLTPFENAC